MVSQGRWQIKATKTFKTQAEVWLRQTWISDLTKGVGLIEIPSTVGAGGKTESIFLSGDVHSDECGQLYLFLTHS